MRNKKGTKKGTETISNLAWFFLVILLTVVFWIMALFIKNLALEKITREMGPAIFFLNASVKGALRTM